MISAIEARTMSMESCSWLVKEILPAIEDRIRSAIASGYASAHYSDVILKNGNVLRAAKIVLRGLGYIVESYKDGETQVRLHISWED